MTAPVHSDSADATQAAREWIMRLSSGDITETEMAALGEWRSAPSYEAVFQHELALWRSLEAAQEQLAPRAGQRALTKLRRRRGYAMAGLAACLALMIAMPDALLRLKADRRSGTAVQAFSLPDGSQVSLDAESALAIHFDHGERRIQLLKGRAWFHVAHDPAKPFRVTANGGMVEDVGTAFTVSAQGGQSEAAVTEGIVRVRSASASLTLTQGQSAQWNSSAPAARAADIPVGRIAAWRDGDVLLNETPVRKAIAEIARYRRGPTFAAGDIDALAPVTAIIRADRADEGLDALAASASLRITRLPGGIAIIRPVQ